MIYILLAFSIGLLAGYGSHFSLGHMGENFFSLLLFIFFDLLLTGICKRLTGIFAQRSFLLASFLKLLFFAGGAYLGQVLHFSFYLYPALFVIIGLDVFKSISKTGKILLKRHDL